MSFLLDLYYMYCDTDKVIPHLVWYFEKIFLLHYCDNISSFTQSAYHSDSISWSYFITQSVTINKCYYSVWPLTFMIRQPNTYHKLLLNYIGRVTCHNALDGVLPYLSLCCWSNGNIALIEARPTSWTQEIKTRPP